MRVDPVSQRRRFPPWLKKRLPTGGKGAFVRGLLADLRLETVCQSAQCPNAGECFACGTATFMILGAECTRNCRFCAVHTSPPAPVDPDEPRRVAEAAARMKLRYVVITSVTRDDLPDGGAGQFRSVIEAVRERADADVEVLTPDFQGKAEAIDTVALARPTVYNHNVETVPRLYAQVRPEAVFARSLDLLARVKETTPDATTKSGIMVGLGETNAEVLETLECLRGVSCDMVTIGQYLRPSDAHLPVARFVAPEEFQDMERAARGMGFKAVAAGPFVRSSYHAGMLFHQDSVAATSVEGQE